LICQDLLQVFQSRGYPFAALQKRLIATDKIDREPHVLQNRAIADLMIGKYTHNDQGCIEFEPRGA